MTLAVAATAPTLFVLALADRKPVPIDDTPLAPSQAVSATELRRAMVTAPFEVTLGESRLNVRLQTDDATGARTVFVDVRDDGAPLGPDVLAYWQTSPANSGLADDAALLGSVFAQRRNAFLLPSQPARGNMVLYSLAEQNALGGFLLGEDTP